MLRIARTHARVLLADDRGSGRGGGGGHRRRWRTRSSHAFAPRARAGRCAPRVPACCGGRPTDRSSRARSTSSSRKASALTILDFKTDREPSELKDQYRAPAARSTAAPLPRCAGGRVEGVLVRI